MAPITDLKNYDIFKGPGLYVITNQASGTVLDLSDSAPEAGVKIIGYPRHNGDNQKWYIVDAGDNEWLIINRKVGTYVQAEANGAPAVSALGFPDKPFVRWRIEIPDATQPQIILFQSVASLGAVLELTKGSEEPKTPVSAQTQSEKSTGQKWLLQKVT